MTKLASRFHGHSTFESWVTIFYPLSKRVSLLVLLDERAIFFFISSGGCCSWSNGKLCCLFVSSFWLIVVSLIVGLFGRHVALCCWIILLLNLSWPKWSSLGRLNCGHDKLNLNRHFIHERSGIWLEQQSSKNRIEWSTNWDSVFIYFIHERDVWNPLRLSFGWCLMRQKNCLTTSD